MSSFQWYLSPLLGTPAEQDVSSAVERGESSSAPTVG